MPTPRDCITPKERSKEIKYAVGMIVTCNSNRYDSYINTMNIGVIIGWDEIYNSEVIIKPEYRILYNYSRPENITLKQPFYTVLSENGNTYYAGEGTSRYY